MLRNLGSSIDGESVFTRISRVVKVMHARGLTGELKPLRLPKLLFEIVGHPMGPGLIHAAGAVNHPERVAVIADDGTWNYLQFHQFINQVAHLFNLHGLMAGDRVIFMLPNSGTYGAAYMAVFRAGLAAVHASYRLTSDELAYMIEHSNAKAILFHADCRQAVLGLPNKLRTHITLFETGASTTDAKIIDFDQVVPSQPTTMPKRPQKGTQNENIVYTSGTTGKPKGAVRDMAGLQIDEPARILERLPMQAAQKHLVVSPMYHSAGQIFFVLGSLLGNTVHVHNHFDPERVLKELHEFNIRSLFMVPTMIQRILALPEEVRERYHPDLDVLISGAAPFSHALRIEACDYFGDDCMFDFYGSTETGWVTIIDGSEMRLHPGSVGRAISGTRLYVIDKNGNEQKAGEVGELYIANHQVIDGYHNDEAATKASTWQDGFSAGDLAWLDDEGFLYLAGRAKEMIISGGVNIYPREIEEVLDAHPGITDSAVFGIEDKEWGEKVVCVYVSTAEPLPEDELLAYLKEKIAGFKIPRAWHVLEELPRNPTGKVLKRELAQLFQ